MNSGRSPSAPRGDGGRSQNRSRSHAGRGRRCKVCEGLRGLHAVSGQEPRHGGARTLRGWWEGVARPRRRREAEEGGGGGGRGGYSH